MSENSNSEKGAADAKLSHYARMLEQGLEMASVAARGGRAAVATSLRGAMPLLEFYSGVSAKGFETETADDAEAAPRILDLSPGQTEVVKAATTKVFGEVLEVTSVTHPVYVGAPAYARAVNGQAQTPHLMHFLALAAAARDLFGDDEDEPELPQEEPLPIIVPERTVAYLSLAPGEYQQAIGPQTPTEIRRAAMRARTNVPPPPAMMASNNQPAMMMSASLAHGHKTAIMPYTGAAQGFAQTGAAAAVPAAAQGCGCGSGCACGCSCKRGAGCSCGRCGYGVPFGGARYKDDGTCAPIAQVSCETQWRVRDCLKYAFCDMLRCIGEEMCDDECKLKEDINVGDCVEVFLCSLINCLPEAICPPEKPKHACPPKTAPGCDCNFAVGE